MPPVESPAVEAPLTPAQLFQQTKDNRGKTAEEIAAAAKSAEPDKRPSGDERKFQKRLRAHEEKLRAEFDAKLAALTPKEKAAEQAATEGAPQREAFATEDEYQDARVAYLAKQSTEKALKDRDAEAATNQTVKEAVAGYNERMARGPLKYDDWNEVQANAKGAALNVDLSQECPALFWAITISPYNDDCFYAWLKDSSKLQALIDQYKTNPDAALAAFHRFEGRVGKDEIPEKKAPAAAPAKAQDAAGKPKPKPTSEVTARAGSAAPQGAPEMFIKGTHTINPEWKAWRRSQGK